MATSLQILADIDLRYRNSFSQAQKLVWFNEEQLELFDVLELDSPPYTFQTVGGEHFYPFPDQFDVTKIKTVTYQLGDADNPQYTEVDFVRNDDGQRGMGIWYTIIVNAMYLHIPGAVPDDRSVYIYCDSDPTEVTSVNVGSPPDLPTKYQELLKFGVLKRIAEARKDVVMQNNYNASYEQKLSDMLWQKKLSEPEWTQPNDMMPRAGAAWNYRHFDRAYYWGG